MALPGLRCVIVVFPDHTHLLLFLQNGQIPERAMIQYLHKDIYTAMICYSDKVRGVILAWQAEPSG